MPNKFYPNLLNVLKGMDFYHFLENIKNNYWTRLLKNCFQKSST